MGFTDTDIVEYLKVNARPGWVFQINEVHGRQGWIGAFVMATEIKPWGIQGFVHHVKTHDTNSQCYIRLKWEELDYIGTAAMIPQDLQPPEPGKHDGNV
jgi:hypothetical protein